MDSPPGSLLAPRPCNIHVPLGAAPSWGLLAEESIREKLKASGRNSSPSTQAPKQPCCGAAQWVSATGDPGRGRRGTKSSSSLSSGALCDKALAEHSSLLGEDPETWLQRRDSGSSLCCYPVAIQGRAPVPGALQNPVPPSPLSQSPITKPSNSNSLL